MSSWGITTPDKAVSMLKCTLYTNIHDSRMMFPSLKKRDKDIGREEGHGSDIEQGLVAATPILGGVSP